VPSSHLPSSRSPRYYSAPIPTTLQSSPPPDVAPRWVYRGVFLRLESSRACVLSDAKERQKESGSGQIKEWRRHWCRVMTCDCGLQASKTTITFQLLTRNLACCTFEQPPSANSSLILTLSLRGVIALKLYCLSFSCLCRNRVSTITQSRIKVWRRKVYTNLTLKLLSVTLMISLAYWYHSVTLLMTLKSV